MDSEMLENISELVNISPYENLKEILGKKLGSSIYKLVDDAISADKELNLLHDAIALLYNKEVNVEIVKNLLDDIDKLHSK